MYSRGGVVLSLALSRCDGQGDVTHLRTSNDKAWFVFGYMKMNCSQDVYSILTKTNTFLYLKYISGCPRKIPIFREIPDHLHL